MAEGNSLYFNEPSHNPKPPNVAAEFESTVVVLLPEMLYEEPILSAVLAADKRLKFVHSMIWNDSCPHKLVRIQVIKVKQVVFSFLGLLDNFCSFNYYVLLL